MQDVYNWSTLTIEDKNGRRCNSSIVHLKGYISILNRYMLKLYSQINKKSILCFNLSMAYFENATVRIILPFSKLFEYLINLHRPDKSVRLKACSNDKNVYNKAIKLI